MLRRAKSTCDTPATYIIYYICVVAFLKEISLLYKGDTEKQSLLYIGDSESESQKHNRFFKAVFFVNGETMLCGCKIFRPIQRLRSFSLIFLLVMLEYIYSTRGVYLLYSQTVGYIYPTSRLYIIDSINIRKRSSLFILCFVAQTLR